MLNIGCHLSISKGFNEAALEGYKKEIEMLRKEYGK